MYADLRLVMGLLRVLHPLACRNVACAAGAMRGPDPGLLGDEAINKEIHVAEGAWHRSEIGHAAARRLRMERWLRVLVPAIEQSIASRRGGVTARGEARYRGKGGQEVCLKGLFSSSSSKSSVFECSYNWFHSLRTVVEDGTHVDDVIDGDMTVQVTNGH